MSKISGKNIFGEKLKPCCMNPKTGFLRDGYCNTNEMDQGSHVVCAIVTEKFLDYTKSQGNDLSTPVPEYEFPGLKEGDGWCLCANRWLEAYRDGFAPPIKGHSTHEKALLYIPKNILEEFSVDGSI
jgi:uncharacterized protein (DUF2237 family)|tara:strand:+ start:210 stop:590 length:381 start_codon:yes stop_codon:yes gene_type:complete